MIPASDFTDTLGNILWCQSADNGTKIGNWFLPNGTEVSTIDSPSHPLHVYHVEGQVGLLRDFGLGALPDLQGLYKCVIPDENDVNQTLWVSAYGDAFYDGFMKGNIVLLILVNWHCLFRKSCYMYLTSTARQSSYFY